MVGGLRVGHCKHLQVLESGATLVDVPGVHDSNAARGSVAEAYMKKCSHYLIVSPIKRAVNDRAAKARASGHTFFAYFYAPTGHQAVVLCCSCGAKACMHLHRISADYRLILLSTL